MSDATQTHTPGHTAPTLPADFAGTRTGDHPDVPPDAVPGYELLDKLGQGAMGVVYQARNLRLNRLVAVKMLLGGYTNDPKHLIRFLAEAEAVAAVKHPNVVQVYEFGEAGGRPFIALEHLPGGTLSARLREPLSPHTAAELLAQIARGVAAAHDQSIVHRDLKPGNVLFGADGVPKVSDFGLAKRGTGGGLTETHAVMGTPAYMPPEQAWGNTKFVGPEADVWALGVILYEALTGRRPFDGNDTRAILTRVVTAEPVPPRKVNPATPRDLELICLKCLSKQPHERYPTAKELADDLDRFTRGETISVRPAGPVQRTTKWVRRNKAVAALLAAVALALVAGSAVSVGFGLQARREAKRANAEADRAEREAADARAAEDKERAARQDADREKNEATAVMKFLQQLLLLSTAGEQLAQGQQANPNITLRQALDHAARTINSGRFKDQPLVEAELRMAIGQAYRGLGAHRESEPHVRTALEIRERVLGPDDPKTLESVDSLGIGYQHLGQIDKAVPLYERAFHGREQVYGSDHITTLWTLNTLAHAYQFQGKLDQAEPKVIRVRDTAARLFGPNHPLTASSTFSLGYLHYRRGNDPRAAELLEDAIRRAEKAYPPDHPEITRYAYLLGLVYLRQLRYEQSHELTERVLAGRRKMFGPEHPDTNYTARQAALLRMLVGRHDQAATLLVEFLPHHEKVFGPKHRETFACAGLLGVVYRNHRKYAEAEPHLIRARDGFKEVAGPDDPATINAEMEVAFLYDDTNRRAMADPLWKRVGVANAKKQVASSVWQQHWAIARYGEVLLREKKYAAAEPLLVRGYRGLVDGNGPAWHRRIALDWVIALYQQTDRPDEVKKWQTERAKYPEVAPPPRPKQ